MSRNESPAGSLVLASQIRSFGPIMDMVFAFLISAGIIAFGVWVVAVTIAAGLPLAWPLMGLQLSLTRKAGSGSSLIALNETFRQCWRDFLTAKEDKARNYAFGDLANTLEISCAVFRDKVFFGGRKICLRTIWSACSV